MPLFLFSEPANLLLSTPTWSKSAGLTPSCRLLRPEAGVHAGSAHLLDSNSKSHNNNNNTTTTTAAITTAAITTGDTTTTTTTTTNTHNHADNTNNNKHTNSYMNTTNNTTYNDINNNDNDNNNLETCPPSSDLTVPLPVRWTHAYSMGLEYTSGRDRQFVC